MKRLWVLGSSVLLLVPACSDSNGSGSSPIGDGPSLAGLLHAVPDTADSRGNPVYYGNLTVVRAGQLPDNFDDDLALLVENSSGQVFLPDAVRSGIREPEFAQYAGFDTRQIAVALEYGVLPDTVAVLVGTMKSGAIQKGLEASPGGEATTKEQVGAVTYLSLGEDGASDFGSVSPIRRVGQPLRLAIEGDTLYWGRTRASVEAAVGAVANAAPSLADDANYLAVAGALDAAKVANGILVAPAAAESWSLAGLGETFQGDASTVTVALLYATPAMATAAVAAFRAHIESGVSLVSSAPWSAVLTVVDISASGPLMTATLTSKRPGLAANVVVTQDNLLQF